MQQQQSGTNGAGGGVLAAGFGCIKVNNVLLYRVEHDDLMMGFKINKYKLKFK